LLTFLKYNIWAVLWGVLIILLTVLPGKVLPRLPHFLDLIQPDKIVHVFIFTVYVWLQIRGLQKQTGSAYLRRNALMIALAAATVLAAGTELLQACCIPLRTGSIYDVIANTAGCLAGCWGAVKIKDKEEFLGRDSKA
jgi:VanZ family protein